jgi:excinuclease ABC subunit A
MEQGNSVVVNEHNLDVIKTADHVLDLGPGGGVRGGEVVAQGVPEHVATVEGSYTAQYLTPRLERATRNEPAPA